MKNIETMTMEARRETIKAIKAHRKALIETFRATMDKTPAETISELVGLLGYAAAAETVAELVNSVGDWDGRVYDYVRTWAGGIETAATREEMEAHYIYQPSEIHPAHINQIGQAMRDYTPAPEEEETTEETETETAQATEPADVMKELEEAAALAIRRYPGDWKKAGRPTAADLIGAAWIKLQERGDGNAWEAAKSALFAEAWSMSGHSVGGSVEELTGMEEYDGTGAQDLAEAAAAIGASADRRPIEAEVISAETVAELASDPMDRAIIAARLRGLTQEETADMLHITRATVNRRLQAMKKRLEK